LQARSFLHKCQTLASPASAVCQSIRIAQTSTANATSWWTHHPASLTRQPTSNLMEYVFERFQNQVGPVHVDEPRKRPAMQERQLRGTSGAALPAAVGVALVDLVHADASHRRSKIATYFRQHMSIAEVRSCLNNRFRARQRIIALENS